MARTTTNTKALRGGKSSWHHPRPRGTLLPARPLLDIPTTTRVLRSQTKILPQTPQVIKAGKGAETTKRRKRLDPWYPKRKVNKNPKPRSPPPTHFTCRICVSDLPSSNFISWVTLRRARAQQALDAPFPCIAHLARNPYKRNIDPVCKTCIGSFMAARLDTLGARRVNNGCTEPGCETPWPLELVTQYLPTTHLEAYNLASFEHWLTDTPLFTCLSPTCTAKSLPDPTAPGYPQVQCPICAFRSCITCLTPWHTSQTCAEIRAAALSAQITDPEKETLHLMQSKDGKRCPNCQLVIEKDGGCASMFCPGCKKYFNWETAASAVLGAKKALPVAGGEGYWLMAGSVVCEVDGLEGEVAEGGFGDDVGLIAPGRFDPFMFALPDEDDPDL